MKRGLWLAKGKVAFCYALAGFCFSGASIASVAGFAECALKAQEAQEAHREGSLHDRQTFEGSTMDGSSRTM